MTRPEDWTLRLSRFIDGARGRTFAYGTWDCCLFAADWLVALGWSDPAADYRGRYDDLAGARRELARHGHADAERAASELLGGPILIRQAQRGDLVSSGSVRWPGLGVCLGRDAAFLAPAGLSFVPMGSVRAAWRV